MTSPGDAPSRAPVVRLRDVTRTHGTVQVLAPTSAEVGVGQALVIAGANGSGKSSRG